MRSDLDLRLQSSSAIASGGRGKLEKCEIFRNFDFFDDLSGFCYTSPPRGNQVGDLPRALHMGLGELASVGVWRLYVILGVNFIFWGLF